MDAAHALPLTGSQQPAQPPLPDIWASCAMSPLRAFLPKTTTSASPITELTTIIGLTSEGADMTFYGLAAYITPILLLTASNVFMTIAWYGHLRFKDYPLPLVVLASWGIAFVEYCLAVPANRYGNAVYSAAQLKTMQEVITLVVFAGFSYLVLKEPLGWNHAAGFTLIAAGVAVIFFWR
jgi:uncharacterized protein (DUF486 family)